MDSHRQNKPIVLVVDDEYLVRIIAAEMLEDAGFVVLQAVNGDEALQMLETHPEVTVLFTDINMPGSLDGLELARLACIRRPRLRIILTSGRMGPDACVTPPGGVFVPKPYRCDDIVSLIEAAAV